MIDIKKKSKREGVGEGKKDVGRDGRMKKNIRRSG